VQRSPDTDSHDDGFSSRKTSTAARALLRGGSAGSGGSGKGALSPRLFQGFLSSPLLPPHPPASRAYASTPSLLPAILLSSSPISAAPAAATCSPSPPFVPPRTLHPSSLPPSPTSPPPSRSLPREDRERGVPGVVSSSHPLFHSCHGACAPRGCPSRSPRAGSLPLAYPPSYPPPPPLAWTRRSCGCSLSLPFPRSLRLPPYPTLLPPSPHPSLPPPSSPFSSSHLVAQQTLACCPLLLLPPPPASSFLPSVAWSPLLSAATSSPPRPRGPVR